MTSDFAPRFGTDGLRGRAGRPPLDPPTLRRVGAALGIWLQREGPPAKRVVLGNDGRASSEWIRDALTEGLRAAEIGVVDAGLLTTPALAHVTRLGPFVAGVMISASHNPPEDNGVKIFDAEGRKLGEDAEREIERLCESAEMTPSGRVRVEQRVELADAYEEYVVNRFADLDLEGKTVVLDAAHGGGSLLAARILRGFGARVIETASAPDGRNINEGVGALHPENIVPAVLGEGALLGVCLDGDGDRCIFVDDAGRVHDGDATLVVLARDLVSRDALPHRTVVATVMSNLGLHRALACEGITVHTTPVGDRAVVEAMRCGGYALGGEQSGHLVLAEDGHMIGDGLVTALAVLSCPAIEEGSAALFSAFQRYPQVLENVPVREKPPLLEIERIRAAVAEAEQRLGEEGRVLLRYSGTEPLCRVMVEGPDEEVIAAYAESIAAAVRVEIGA